jgi:hypothetical protein
MADAVEQLRNIHGIDIPAHIDYPNGVPAEAEVETEETEEVETEGGETPDETAEEKPKTSTRKKK